MSEEFVFQFSPEVLAIPFGVATVSIVACITFYRRKRGRPAVVAFIVALVAGAFFGPAMLHDKVVVTPTSITQTTGFWWSPTTKGFRYDEVASVYICEKRGGLKNRQRVIWEIRHQNGSHRDIDPGDLWETNTDKIVPLLTHYGVTFVFD